MPFGDGTGPMGYGPMTGRGLGWCSTRFYPGRGFSPLRSSVWFNPNAPRYGWTGLRGPGLAWRHGWYGRGAGFGRGYGFGRGWGRGWW
ncbi:DUF5320 domain-containing protein [Kosmotoga olearia]|uniref:Cytoplasmic protein n=1 Tax=Kosmotoga olearia (strain ATCC BAA-1733 / DSM 21960 / TBF 19.5.1) TaxID=521045 RepID=C5CHZ6_KOSOT|nr:DUF5320 domain-containing protein [Kosmotoga olearia]ACR79832.1 putative cytoplasmic protein [Kosmotoga olearia TBF 19.5.1]MDK2954113.1 hypothetical protein [Kosmotoga sp.]